LNRDLFSKICIITINGGAGLDTIKNTNDLGLTCETGKNIYFNVGAGNEIMRVHNNACVGIGVSSPVFMVKSKLVPLP